MHGNLPTIMDQGAALYGQALRQLSVRINDQTTCFDHANVSATMTLHLYEVCGTPTEDGQRLTRISDHNVLQPKWLD